jgi:uncharacterized membrane protein
MTSSNVWKCRVPFGCEMNSSGNTSNHRFQIMLAIFFLGAGCLHFVFPASYMKIMPPWLPWHFALVMLSGVLEMAGGLGVLFQFTRRFAGYGLILLALAVLPANVQMLLNAHAAGDALGWQALLLMRLPLQLLLIFWIWRATQPKQNEVIGGR